MAATYRKYFLAFAMFAGALIGAFPSSLFAQNGLDRDPGYVDFSDFDDRFDAKATAEVNIRGKLLELVAEASRGDDPEFADLLLRLRAIQVRGYPMHRTQISAMERLSESIGEELEDHGWDTVVRLRDYGQYVDVYVIENAEFILGMMMMVVDAAANETVLINIVGDIQADELGRIGNKFDIGPLEGVMNNR